MKLIRAIPAFYPQFPLGCEPSAVPCELRIVEGQDGTRFLQTPFAFMRAYGDDDAERQIGRGYYATQADCEAYLAAEYPQWKAAVPIMDALFTSRHHYGAIVGDARIADKLNVTVDELYNLARGHRSVSRVSSRAKLVAKTS